jgi:hypothetical protein
VPITADEASKLAKKYAATHWSEAFKSGRRVVGLTELSPERAPWPAVYAASKVPLEACWLVSFSRSDRVGLYPSTIVVVSRATGEVVYAGSACDEG